MTSKEKKLIDAYLIPGMWAADLEGEEIPVPSDIVLKNYIILHCESVKRWFHGPHSARVHEILDGAMARISAKEMPQPKYGSGGGTLLENLQPHERSGK